MGSERNWKKRKKEKKKRKWGRIKEEEVNGNG